MSPQLGSFQVREELPPAVAAIMCYPDVCRIEAPFPQVLELLSAERPWLDTSPGIVLLSRGVALPKVMLPLQG